MPHRKHSNDDLVVIIQTLIETMGLYLRNQGDNEIRRILIEVIEHVRMMVTPNEFIAEKCPDTPDFEFMNKKQDSNENSHN
jgi:hypothetical protein